MFGLGFPELLLILVIVVIIWLLQAFGLMGSLSKVRVR